ncbi:energy transducer TonB family protein [Sphingopyxis sp. MG]|uniref:energy transducer TonB family protein n=1 Tax=Sphingopyxis sp. MG TaxID=1866325 RepID=UPI001F1F9F59|nr:energy transducer TonB [Sphingopyxis sp. MG]
MRPRWTGKDDGRRAGYGQPSAWSRRLGAGLAAATCCLLMLAVLDANLSGLLRPTQPAGVSSFTLFTPSPPQPPSAEPRLRTSEAPRSPEPRPSRPTEPVPTNEKGGSIASPLPVPPAIVPLLTVTTASRPSTPEPPVAPPQAQNDKNQTALAAYQRQLWARIAARKPVGIRLVGVAAVRFTVGGDGALVAVELAASSGNTALDRLALRTVRNASPFPPPPATVEEEQLVFTIPFSFH